MLISLHAQIFTYNSVNMETFMYLSDQKFWCAYYSFQSKVCRLHGEKMQRCDLPLPNQTQSGVWCFLWKRKEKKKVEMNDFLNLFYFLVKLITANKPIKIKNVSLTSTSDQRYQIIWSRFSQWDVWLIPASVRGNICES